MITGIGIDLIELNRIEKHIQDDAFINRVLTPAERKLFYPLGSKRKIEFLAGRFSAKEAYAKAKGTGLGASLSFQDMSIINDSHGKPVLMDKTLTEMTVVHLSITHTDCTAAAVAVIESLSC
ncbi:holo-[acyl-carrier-protein] synthase [Sporolactobacillus sp. THM7-4]|nr:holo-[acyl-carrier-protein] synthase [Sporolactobacillus sp. THM7-4]